MLSEERVTGTVTTELGTGQQGRISYENRGECFFLPYGKDDVEGNVTLSVGDKVSFQIATSYRYHFSLCEILSVKSHLFCLFVFISGNLGARYIRLKEQHPYGLPMCPSSPQVAISRGGPVQSPRMIHQLASSTQMMTTPKPSPSQQMQMPGKVSRQVQKQQQQRLMPSPSPSPSMMMTHSQHGSMNEGGGPMTPVTITPRGTGKQQPQPSTMPSPNTAIPMNRKNFNRSTGRNFKGPAKLPKEKTPEKLTLPEIIYRPTPPMSMNTTLVAKLVRLVGTERTLKKTSKTKAVAAPIQTSNRYSI